MKIVRMILPNSTLVFLLNNSYTIVWHLTVHLLGKGFSLKFKGFYNSIFLDLDFLPYDTDLIGRSML